MAVFTEKQKRLTKKLIGAFTGFSVTEDNFKLCFQFCKSNFRFHRFLSVNDVSITRAIDGLVEKFKVHSQPEKAEFLQSLTDSFLSSCLFHSYPHSDAHYGVLSLLLNLSQSPLHSTFEPATPTAVPVEEAEEFDWTSYLMAGIEYSSSSSESEWSDSDSENTSRDIVQPLRPRRRGEGQEGEGQEQDDDEGLGTDVVEESRSWLSQHLVFPYWEGRNQSHDLPDTARSAHPSCQLAGKWACHVMSCDPFHRPVQAVYVSENQIVRETIWLLLGAGDTFVYTFNEGGVKVRENICVSHLTPLALRCILDHCAAMATKLCTMRDFCSCVMKGGVTYVRCRTYEAFASALCGCLDHILRPLRNMEEVIVQHKKTVTMLSLLEENKTTFDLVERLYELFQEGVMCVDKDLPRPSPRQCSSQLLDCLWACLEWCDRLGESGEGLLEVLYPLWMKTIRPYIVMLDNWMTCGTMSDTFNEFCIVRNPELEINTSNYWEECFTLTTEATPTFLFHAMQRVLLAGKSMHLIESIGKLKHIQEGVSHSSPSKGGLVISLSEGVALLTPPPDLYREFIKSMSEVEARPDLPDACDMSCDGPCDEGAWQMSGMEHYDSLMNSYLELVSSSAKGHTSTRPQDRWGGLDVAVPKSSLIPLNLLIQDKLLHLLQQRHKTASGELVDLLRSEFNLTDDVRMVQLFYLMEAGAIAHQFTDEVFRRYFSGDTWRDPLYLNAVLEEAIHSNPCIQLDDNNKQEKRISVVLTPSVSLPTSLSLHYHTPWPLDVLFTEQVMLTYNKVYQLLLHIRWTKWNLEGIASRLGVVRKMGRGLAWKHHFLYLLRSRILYFVNSFYNYLMTRVLHSVGVEFQYGISIATDLEAIISLHTSYLNTIFDRCFLNKKAGMVHEAVVTVLEAGLRFRQCWERGVANFDVGVAESIEKEFMQCCHFLVNTLNKTVQRSALSHLEALAFSLQSFKKAQLIFSRETVHQLNTL